MSADAVQRNAHGHLQLRSGQVNTADHFGGGMLDLETGIELEEVETCRRRGSRGTRPFRPRRSPPAYRVARRPVPSFQTSPTLRLWTGASSIIFWCLRCTEQSRPNREMLLPY